MRFSSGFRTALVALFALTSASISTAACADFRACGAMKRAPC